MRRAVVFAVALLFAAAVRADVYHLVDGDRITGKTLSKTAKAFRVETPYGRLAIPREKVARILFDDGTEEVLVAPAEPSPAPEATPTPEPTLRMVLVITGSQFFNAWGVVPADPTLRLDVTLDEEPLVTYADAHEDPEIPGAVVNSMSFAPEHLTVAGAEGVVTLPPETRPGRITLRIDLPLRRGGERSLRVAYQTNEGTAAAAAWRDAAEGRVHVNLEPEAGNVVEIKQDRGKMEFSRKRMRNVDTFRIEMHPQ